MPSSAFNSCFDAYRSASDVRRRIRLRSKPAGWWMLSSLPDTHKYGCADCGSFPDSSPALRKNHGSRILTLARIIGRCRLTAPMLKRPVNTGSSLSSAGYIPPLSYHGLKNARHPIGLITFLYCLYMLEI